MRLITCIFLILWSLFINSAHATQFSDGPQARKALAEQVEDLFQKGNFSQLEKMADSFRKSRSHFPDGVWKIQIFYTGFDLSGRYPDWVFPKYISLAEEWQKSYPKSVTAQRVLAKVWFDYAWKARGSDYASDVKKDAWPLVEQRLEKAWRILNQPLAKGVDDCPERHNLQLRMAVALGSDRDTFESLFQEALREDPGYYHHYAVKADYLNPKWHGKEGEWQQFITNVADRNPQYNGATIYTRTVWSVYIRKDWTDFNKRSGVSWDRMKAGFEQINRKFPNSPWILNNYAKFACRAGDRDTVIKLFKQIDSRNTFYPEAWETDAADKCRKWIKLGKTDQEVQREQLSEKMRKFNQLVDEQKKGLSR